MTDILPQEVWLANFPFAEDETQSKNRPVIVLDVENLLGIFYESYFQKALQ